jgi:hypothetical protein
MVAVVDEAIKLDVLLDLALIVCITAVCVYVNDREKS